MDKSEAYWRSHCEEYPHQTAVPHMSSEDPDPRKIMKLCNHYFLRVPFNGEAHWGFRTEAGLNFFLSYIKRTK